MFDKTTAEYLASRICLSLSNSYSEGLPGARLMEQAKIVSHNAFFTFHEN